MDYQISDAVIAQYNGKRQGIKLGEPRVEVLGKIKTQSEKAMQKQSGIIKPVQLRAYPNDRKQLKKLAKKINTGNQLDTLNSALDLAEVALGLVERFY